MLSDGIVVPRDRQRKLQAPVFECQREDVRFAEQRFILCQLHELSRIGGLNDLPLGVGDFRVNGEIAGLKFRIKISGQDVAIRRFDGGSQAHAHEGFRFGGVIFAGTHDREDRLGDEFNRQQLFRVFRRGKGEVQLPVAGRGFGDGALDAGDDQHGLIHFRGHGREAVALFDELAAIGQDQFWLLAAVWVCFISEVRFSETENPVVNFGFG